MKGRVMVKNLARKHAAAQALWYGIIFGLAVLVVAVTVVLVAQLFDNGSQAGPKIPTTTSLPDASSETEELKVYGFVLSMQPGWEVMPLQSTSSTYIDSTDPELHCHDLERCGMLRIFDIQVSSGDEFVGSGYTECLSPPEYRGREEVGGESAAYYEAQPCLDSPLPSMHRIWVVPGKAVFVAVGFGGQELPGIERALETVRW